MEGSCGERVIDLIYSWLQHQTGNLKIVGSLIPTGGPDFTMSVLVMKHIFIIDMYIVTNNSLLCQYDRLVMSVMMSEELLSLLLAFFCSGRIDICR